MDTKNLVTIIVALFAATGLARGAVLTTETFGGDSAGWVDRDPVKMTVSYDSSFGNLGGSLRGNFATQALAFVQTDAFRATNSSSSGAFVGNYYNATNYTGFTFDFFAGNVLPSDLIVRFYGAGQLFSFGVNQQVLGLSSWYNVHVPLAYNAGWLGSGSVAFSNALADVQWVDVQVTRSGTSAQSYWMDNFTLTDGPVNPLLVPEPGTGLLAISGLGLLAARRKLRKQLTKLALIS